MPALRADTNSLRLASFADRRLPSASWRSRATETTQRRFGLADNRMQRRVGVAPQLGNAAEMRDGRAALPALLRHASEPQVNRGEIDQFRRRALKTRREPAACFVVASQR